MFPYFVLYAYSKFRLQSKKQEFYNKAVIIVPKFRKGDRVMEQDKRKSRVDYTEKMTNEEYKKELQKMIENIENNELLRYFYIFVSEKLEQVS